MTSGWNFWREVAIEMMCALLDGFASDQISVLQLIGITSPSGCPACFRNQLMWALGESTDQELASPWGSSGEGATLPQRMAQTRFPEEAGGQTFLMLGQ